jgi:hypothetical protein
MTFFFDHDVPEDAAFALKAMGHQVVRLREVLPTTTTDDEVFRYANANDYILVTSNRDDFLSLIGEAPFSGLIVLVRRARRAFGTSRLGAIDRTCRRSRSPWSDSIRLRLADAARRGATFDGRRGFQPTDGDDRGRFVAERRWNAGVSGANEI